MACLVLSLVAGPLSALSCLQPDVARSFAEAAASETAYVIAHGRLDFNARHWPQPGSNAPNSMPPETKLSGRFSGHALTLAGFDRPFVDIPVTIKAQCLGPWCATLAPGQDYLVFLERGPDGYALVAGPFGGSAFPDPTPAPRATLLACLRGDSCKPARH